MRGYTLTEILVVLGVIAVLSLVSIPAFINYQEANVARGAARQLDGDLRQLRLAAINTDTRIRIEFLADHVTYRFHTSSDGGTTWAAYTPVNALTNSKTLDKPAYVSATTFADVNGNSLPDIVFLPNGTLDPNCISGGGSPAVTIRVPWNVTNNTYTISVSAAGFVNSVGSHT